MSERAGGPSDGESARNQPPTRGHRAAWRAGGYAADELIGRGSSGEVWRGRVVRTGELVALKRVEGGAGDWRAAAQREAALLSALDHPNLVRMHNLLTVGDDCLVLVLDLAAGGSLADVLARRTRLTVGEVVTTLAPIGSALAYAHDEAITHSDVSAANVLFSARGRPLLGDLGTARLLGDVAAVQATPAYVDPMVAAGGVPTPAADVFALAGVALHALTGTATWTLPGPGALAETADEVIARAASGEIPELERRLSALPGAVAAVLRRALAVDPHRRGSATDFALDLRHAAAPVPVELAAGRTPSPLPRAARPVAAREDPSPHVPRHAVSRRSARPAELSPKRPGAVERPDFARPRDGGETDSAAVALTHAVRSPPRPSLPPPGRLARLRWHLPAVAFVPSRRIVWGSLALLCGVGSAVGWRLHAASGPAADSAGVAMSAGTIAPASPRIPAPSAMASPTTGEQWSGVLSGLDARRERAFATGDATLLDEVYTAGPLLQQDSATLTTSTPPGCHVSGLRTSYSGIVLISRSAIDAVLRVTAALSRAEVVCGAGVSSYTSPRGPTEMQIGLVVVGSQYRIATLRLLA